MEEADEPLKVGDRVYTTCDMASEYSGWLACKTGTVVRVMEQRDVVAAVFPYRVDVDGFDAAGRAASRMIGMAPQRCNPVPFKWHEIKRLPVSGLPPVANSGQVKDKLTLRLPFAGDSDGDDRGRARKPRKKEVAICNDPDRFTQCNQGRHAVCPRTVFLNQTAQWLSCRCPCHPATSPSS